MDDDKYMQNKARRLKETSMEFNVFQMMNQTHEHESHLLTQQLNGKETRTSK